MLTDRVAHFLEDHVDVALRIGDLPDSGLIATRLGAVRRLTCASPAYLASHSAPVVPQDLADHDVISFESVSTPTTWRYWSDGDELAVTIRSRLGVNTIDAAIDASLAGAGVVRAVSYQVADHVRGGRLQLLLEAYEPVPPPVHLVYDKQNRLPLKLRAFVDYAVPRLRDRLIAVALLASDLTCPTQIHVACPAVARDTVLPVAGSGKSAVETRPEVSGPRPAGAQTRRSRP